VPSCPWALIVRRSLLTPLLTGQTRCCRYYSLSVSCREVTDVFLPCSTAFPRIRILLFCELFRMLVLLKVLTISFDFLWKWKASCFACDSSASLILRRMFRRIWLYLCMFLLASLLSSIVLRISDVIHAFLVLSLRISILSQRYCGYSFSWAVVVGLFTFVVIVTEPDIFVKFVSQRREMLHLPMLRTRNHSSRFVITRPRRFRKRAASSRNRMSARTN